MIQYTIVALIGLIIGSFLNVCIYRIPKGESIAFPGSHCGSCGHYLEALDLIPILSYLMLKGRCRYCKSKVSLQYPLIELINGVLYVLVYYYFGNTIMTIAYALLFSILLVITVIDYRTMLIPNTLIIFGLGVGSIYKIALAVLALDIRILFQGVLGMLIGALSIGMIMALGLLIYSKEAMGMGDLKLLAMFGLFTGSIYVLYALIVAVIVGAVYGVFVLIKKRGDIIPFGPFLSIGGVVAILWGDVLWRICVNYML